MRKYPFEKSVILEQYSTAPAEEFVSWLVNDLRSRCTYVEACGALLMQSIEDGARVSPELLENYISTVPKMMEDISNILDATVNYDQIQKSRDNKQSGTIVSNIMRDDTVEESDILDLWLKESECFIPTLVNYLRDRRASILSKIELIRVDMQNGNSVNPTNLDGYITDILKNEADIMNITRIVVEYDQIQNGKRNSQSNQ